MVSDYYAKRLIYLLYTYYDTFIPRSKLITVILAPATRVYVYMSSSLYISL